MFFKQLWLSICCLGSCPFSTTSRSTRTLFLLLSLTVYALCYILVSDGLKDGVSGLPFCKYSDLEDCKSMPGYFAVYRLCWALFIFYFIFALGMTKVLSSRDHRAGVQVGCWFAKVLVFSVLSGSFMFLPAGDFDIVSMFFSVLGSGYFLLIEAIILARASRSIGHLLWGQWKDGSLTALATLYVMSFTLTGVSLLIGVVVLIEYGECSFNIAVIVIHLLATLVPIFTTFWLPSYRNIGLLQSSVLSAFIMCITWSAIDSNPEQNCRQTGRFFPNLSVVITVLEGVIAVVCISIISFATRKQHLPEEDESQVVVLQRKNEVWNTCVPIISSEMSSFHNFAVYRPGPSRQQVNATMYETTDNYDDEYNSVRYNWNDFHVIQAFAAMFMMMSISNWYHPGWDERPFTTANESAMWFKTVFCWLMGVLNVNLLFVERRHHTWII